MPARGAGSAARVQDGGVALAWVITHCVKAHTLGAGRVCLGIYHVMAIAVARVCRSSEGMHQLARAQICGVDILVFDEARHSINAYNVKRGKGYKMKKTCLNQTELAARWKISPRTLERWRWAGEGPRYLKLEGRVIYANSDIEPFEREVHLTKAANSPLPVSAPKGPARNGAPI